MSLRAAIPLLEITKAIAAGLGQLAKSRLATFKASPAGRDTPRSKFYALKLHWFRPWLESKAVEIIYCKSEEQKADFLAKAVPTPAFKANRCLSMGW